MYIYILHFQQLNTENTSLVELPLYFVDVHTITMSPWLWKYFFAWFILNTQITLREKAVAQRKFSRGMQKED